MPSFIYNQLHSDYRNRDGSRAAQKNKITNIKSVFIETSEKSTNDKGKCVKFISMKA